jgi:hypothetical protein
VRGAPRRERPTLAIPALDEIANQHEDRIRRAAHERLRVGERAVDVGAAAELRAEEQVDRIVQFRGEIDDRRIEDEHRRRDGT